MKKRKAKKIAKREEYEKITELIIGKDPYELSKYLKELSKTRKIEKIREIRKKIEKVRERNPLEEIEKDIKYFEFMLKSWKLMAKDNPKITPEHKGIKLCESTLKKLYQRKKELENEKEKKR